MGSEMCIRDSLSVDPNNVEIWYIKAETLWWMNKSQESLECAEKVLELCPNHEKALAVKAAALFKLAMYREAIRVCDKILRANPRSATAWNIKGSCLASQGRYRKAIECYNKAIELNPCDSASSHSKDQCYLALGIRLCPVCNNETIIACSMKHGPIYLCPNATIIASEKSKFPIMGILPCHGKKPRISKSWFGPKCPNCGSRCIKYLSLIHISEPTRPLYISKEGFMVWVCPNAITRTSEGTLFVTCRS